METEHQPQALYRRYRPRRFDEVAGQATVVEPLRQAVKTGRVGHAYLFAGPRGTGKTTVARIFAKALNCPQAVAGGGEPCGRCPSCVAVDRGSHLDVVEVDAASNRGIDDVREMRERLNHLPVMGPRKVYIIDEVHMLTVEAFNALLKTLEEPPPHVVFLLATTEPHKLPLTVLSRCQRFHFQRLGVPTIVERLSAVLAAEGIGWEPGVLERLAEAADGALRDALSLADQAVGMLEGGTTVTAAVTGAMLGALDEAGLARLLTAMARRQWALVAQQLAEWYRAGGDPRQLLRDLARRLRDVVVLRQAGPEAVPGPRRETAAQFADRLPAAVAPERWFAALDALAEAESRLRGSFPADLVVELAVFKVGELLTTGERAETARPDPATLPATAESSAATDGSEATAAATFSQPASPSERLREALDRLRRRRVSAWALLRQAEVRAVDDRIVIRFAYPAHADVFSRPENRAAFDAVLKEVYGHDVEVGMETAAGASSEDWASRVRRFFGPDAVYVGLEKTGTRPTAAGEAGTGPEGEEGHEF